jgi:hypothetical protein
MSGFIRSFGVVRHWNSLAIQVLSHDFNAFMLKGAVSSAIRFISWLPETVDSVIINTVLALSIQSINRTSDSIDKARLVATVVFPALPLPPATLMETTTIFN